MPKFKSIQTKILLLCGGYLMIASAIMGVSAFFMLRASAYQVSSETIDREATRLAGTIKTNLNTYLGTAGSLSNTLAGIKDPEIELDMSRESSVAVLKSFLSKDPAIKGVYTAWEVDAFDDMDIAYEGVEGNDKSGRFMPYAFLDNSGTTQLLAFLPDDANAVYTNAGAAQSLYQSVKESGKPVILSPHTTLNGNRVVSVAAPVSVGNDFYGIVGIDIDSEFIESMIQSASESESGLQAVVIGPDGTIAGWNEHDTLVNTNINAASDIASYYEATLTQNQANGTSNGYMDSFTTVYIQGVESPWVTGVRIPTSVAMASVNAKLAQLVFLFAGVTGIGMIAMVIASRSIANPIRKAAEALTDIAQGEGDLTLRLPEIGRDELSTLAKGFNSFAVKVQGLLIDVKSISDRVNAVANDASMSSKETLSDMHEQSNQSCQIGAAVEEMSASAEEVSNMTRSTRDKSTHAGELASQGESAVMRTVESIEEIRNAMSSAVNAVSELSTASDQIGEIIAMINDIADQTNLLALNAAIEAARAGEQGRGFAVVADEVRKLAERTQSATSDVESVIRKIQLHTEESVHSMNQATGCIQSGVVAANSAGGSLREIVTSNNEVDSMITQISSTFEEQASASRSIAQSMEQIRILTGKTTELSEVSADRSQELCESVEQLQSVIKQFKIE